MFRKGFGLASLGSACFAVMTVAGIDAASASVLVPHRAVYDLELKDASDRSGISGMYGRMVYEFNGSACEGYTVSFRFVTQVNTGEETRMTDQQTTTYEDLKTGNFRFLTRSFTDEKLDKEVRGTAHDDKTGVKVELTAPDKREVELAASRFPTEHMVEVIDRAKKGESFFEARIFDGSDSGDKTLITSTFVGKSRKPTPDEPDAGKAGKLGAENYWPVTISYFNDDKGGDALPIYRMSFKLYENGITRDLTMDYGDFVLSGKLADLEVFKSEECK
ncbi:MULTISPECIES: cell envelope integrity EipB family protein [unclassified Ensifer]|uniref:cell envelope integrity EipB family protein n=1 Tax=unclassified Ensifer TaxID=2633371 RepID=UPI000812C36A|nr:MULTISPECIES: cell envelope integrity EipB family protein [unclassified Ensifer]OCP17107.1 ATP-binding protein [Ensifer sp. LC163]OCP26344.1 ATP-binding protein [Ensifer sp. LC384]OCP26515.1 ATP-binding protein [Ensifer sp. LC54]